LKEGLEKLYALQQLDDRIREVEISLKDIPETIKRLEQERDGRATIIENARDKLKQNIKDREKLEKEIQVVKDKIKKYKDQMGNATTNKEYQGFMAEIKYEEQNIAALEEKVIEKMVESDDIMNEIRESEAEFKKISEEYNRKITDLKQTTEYNKEKLAENVKNRAAARTTIPANLLTLYDAIAGKRNGKAVSPVETEFCGICNVKIRPQRFNELIAAREVLRCESCGSILYKIRVINNEEEKQN